MTAHDIFQIVSTVAVVQLLCDIVAHYAIYQSKAYLRLLEQLEDSKAKLQAAQRKAKLEDEKNKTDVAVKNKDVKSNNKKQSGGKQNERSQKLLQRLEQDHADVLQGISMRHTLHSATTAIIFLILMRIFGTEHKGRILAVLPFVPYQILRRITARGLQFDSNWLSIDGPIIEAILGEMNTKSRSSAGVMAGLNNVGQMASFTFIYMLTAMSVKYYVHQLIATKPPAGAESFFAAVADSPRSQAYVKNTIGVDLKELKAE
jgi:hypothetical protein